jgi:hypothetical protein
VQTRSFINQTITLLMAAMLLMVAGVKSWSVDNDKAQKVIVHKKSVLDGVNKDSHSKLPEGSQATVSSLSLDAVITPAISFDFSQYFYFLPQPVWSFIPEASVFEVSFKAPIYWFSCFSRIFGRFVVPNAP